MRLLQRLCLQRVRLPFRRWLFRLLLRKHLAKNKRLRLLGSRCSRLLAVTAFLRKNSLLHRLRQLRAFGHGEIAASQLRQPTLSQLRVPLLLQIRRQHFQIAQRRSQSTHL